jgi:predicted metalloprotease
MPSGGGGLKVGGGIGAIIVLVLIVLLNGGLGGGLGGGSTGGVSTEDIVGLPECRTGDDANSNAQCALVADVNSIQAFWADQLPEQSGTEYEPSKTVFFDQATSTGCGEATSAVGPFYCPVDKTVYLDTTFFDDMLEGQLGAEGGPFSEAYVLAHEYGHHVQDLLGTMGRVRTQQGPKSDGVRLELQADCYAGAWARSATTVPDENGEVLILDLTEDDVRRAINAAQAVGDDRIQQRASGSVNPEQWTHGSAAQRERWFKIGYATGSLEACDTFATDDL